MAAMASTLPQPQTLLMLSRSCSGPVLMSLRAVDMIISRTSTGVRAGLACSSRATMPVTAGLDIEVPDISAQM